MTSTSTSTASRPTVHRVALAQIAPVLADRQRNVGLHLEQIKAARAQEADLIVFPELSLTGYFVRDMVPDVAITPDAPEIRELLDAAGPMAVVLGFVEESPQHRFYNTALYAEGGRVVHLHRKVYLPTYGLFDEQRYFAAGERFLAFDTARFGRMGILICEDFWHLSAAAIMQAEEIDVLDLPRELARPRRRGTAGPHGRDLRAPLEGLRPTDGRGGDRRQPRGVRGRAVLLGRQLRHRAGWTNDRPGPATRRIADAGHVRRGRSAPPAADHALGPRRTAAA